jgi:squalene-associated FAD-dependent desaturase
MDPPMRRRVAIVGGGFAGLAAGVALAERGHEVIVLEAKRRLGGRAYSFRDAATGAIVDNGQHAMMGCYAHTLAFLERIGAADRVVRQRDLRVEMRGAYRGSAAVAAVPLPAPLHVAGALLRYRHLTPVERLRALVAGLRVLAMRQRHDPFLARATVADLLERLGQSPNARHAFWYPVAISTCNELPERAAAAPFAEVLARAFFGSRQDSQFVFARVGLSDLYTDLAAARIAAHGGRVEIGAPVSSIETDGGRATALLLRDGRRIAVDACIVSAPPDATHALLPPEVRTRAPWRDLHALGASPIVSVHLWWDRPVVGADFAGLIGTATQFAFDRTRLCGTPVEGGGSQVSSVISAAHVEECWDNARLASVVEADLRAVFPAARDAHVLRTVVVKEKHATISCTPEAERLRPGAETPLDNLFLAGDWTATGLPPTIEGAVLSGDRAAQLAAAAIARSASSVVAAADQQVQDFAQASAGGR